MFSPQGDSYRVPRARKLIATRLLRFVLPWLEAFGDQYSFSLSLSTTAGARLEWSCSVSELTRRLESYFVTMWYINLTHNDINILGTGTMMQLFCSGETLIAFKVQTTVHRRRIKVRRHDLWLLRAWRTNHPHDACYFRILVSFHSSAPAVHHVRGSC